MLLDVIICFFNYYMLSPSFPQQDHGGCLRVICYCNAGKHRSVAAVELLARLFRLAAHHGHHHPTSPPIPMGMGREVGAPPGDDGDHDLKGMGHPHRSDPPPAARALPVRQARCLRSLKGIQCNCFG